MPVKTVLLCRIDGNFGGVERNLLAIAKGLDRSRYRPVIVPIANPGELARIARDSGMEHTFLPMQSRFDVKQAAGGMLDIAKKYGADIIHTFGIRSNTLASRIHKVASAAWVVRVPNINSTDYANPVIGWLSHQYNNHLLRKADAVQVISPHLHDYFQSWRRKPKRMYLIPNGVDIKRFSPATNKKWLCDKYGIPEDAKIIGSAGRLEWVKGYDLLLQAFREVLRDHLNSRLVLIGEGSEREKLEALADSIGISNFVVFTGYKPQVTRYLTALDVFVSSSRSEGVPNAVLEAMACGLPVAATKVGGVESIIRDRVDGLLIPSPSVVQIAEAVSELLRSKNCAQCIAEQARRRIEEDFSVGRMLDNVQAMYEELIAGKQSGINQ